MQRLGNFVKKVGGAVLLLAMLGFGIGSSRPMPDYAQVFIDEAKRVYIAPPCITDPSGLRLVTARQAYDLKCNPEGRCRDKEKEEKGVRGERGQERNVESRSLFRASAGVDDVRGRSHVKLIRQPLQWDRRLSAHLRGDPGFARVTFRQARQGVLV